MALYVKKKPYPQQLNNIFHYSLIKIIALHQLNLLNMPWETFISHEMFKDPQIFSSVHQEERGPSGHKKVKEIKTVGVPMFVTYQRGTRRLFAAARRVLSPQGVEGSLPSSSAKQVQTKQQSKVKGKGKKRMHKKDLGDGKERDFDLVDHEETQGVDVIDLDAQSPKIVKDMIIKEQEAEI